MSEFFVNPIFGEHADPASEASLPMTGSTAPGTRTWTP